MQHSCVSTPCTNSGTVEKALSTSAMYGECCVHHWWDHPHFVKANAGRTRDRQHSIKLSNLESQVCDIFRLFTTSACLSLSTIKRLPPSLPASVHFISPFVSTRPPPFLHCLSLVLSPPPLSHSPRQSHPSTMAIMTHLPVKLLPVETARPWHRTHCLSASLLKSLKLSWYYPDSHWDYTTL